MEAGVVYQPTKLTQQAVTYRKDLSRLVRRKAAFFKLKNFL
jgi:hypothetical protein